MVYNYDPQTDYLQIFPKSKSKKCTPLMHAILQDNEDKVREILKNDPNTINARNEEGWTALHIVACNSKEWNLFKYLQILLDNKADPNIQSINRHTTPLIYAVLNTMYDPHIETLRILLEYKADPNIRDIFGRTPLMIVAYNLYSDNCLEMARLLLDYGADPKLTDREYRNYTCTLNFYFLEKRIKELEHQNELLRLQPTPGIDFINTFMEEFGKDDPDIKKKFVDAYIPVLEKHLDQLFL